MFRRFQRRLTTESICEQYDGMPMAPLLAGLSPGFSRQAPLLVVLPVKRPLTAIQVRLFCCRDRRTFFCCEQYMLSRSHFAGRLFPLLLSKLDMCLTQKSRGSLQVNARDLNAVERGIRGYQANAEKNVKNGQHCAF